MEHRLDEVAKVLAQGVSRREALRRIGGGLAGALLASLGYKRAWAGSVDCRQFCRDRFNPGTYKQKFGKCSGGCNDCQDGGGTPCSASPSTGIVTCCSSGQVCQGGQCVSPIPVCTAPFETTETGTCSGSNATCVCPKDHYCCQGTGASANLYQCCEVGYHISCDTHVNGFPRCIS